MSETSLRRRPLEWWERRKLETNGCRAQDWSAIRICDATDLEAIRNVEFAGAVSIGISGHGTESGIENARLENCVIGDYALIRNIGMHIRECRIGRGAHILSTAAIEFEPEAMCGVGTEVAVLDETGSRSVTIYPGLSAQGALLAAREPKWRERHLQPLIDEKLEEYRPVHKIGDNARVENCGILHNVIVDNEVKVIGARCSATAPSSTMRHRDVAWRLWAAEWMLRILSSRMVWRIRAQQYATVISGRAPPSRKVSRPMTRSSLPTARSKTERPVPFLPVPTRSVCTKRHCSSGARHRS